MTDSKQNTVSIKIWEATQSQLLTEQARLRRETGEKPTFAELVATAWEQADRSPLGDSLMPRNDEERDAVRQILVYLRTGNKMPSLEGEAMAIPQFLRRTIASIVANVKTEEQHIAFQNALRVIAASFNVDSPPETGITIVRKNSS